MKARPVKIAMCKWQSPTKGEYELTMYKGSSNYPSFK